MVSVSCVLFDLGGVIVNWDISWLIQEISNEFQLSEKRLSEEFNKNIPNISSGKIDEKNLWYSIGKELQSSKLMNLDESLLDKNFRKRVSLNDSLVSLTKKLSEKGITVGILSNTEQVTFSVVRELLPLDHFKYKFLSYEIGLIKPNPEIYKYVIDNISFQKEELFFIDDLKENVESARIAGIDSVQFFDYEQLLKECRLRNII